MITIQIKNVGPLVDTGIVELSQYNVIIGKQSTGKSTFMKILCYCQWLEKKIMTDNKKAIVREYTHYNTFLKRLQKFHGLNESFFSKQSEIHYQGYLIDINLAKGAQNISIKRKNGFEEYRYNFKLSFIPSERNLITAVKNIDKAYRTSENDFIINHIFEWGEAKEHVTRENPMDLSIVGDMEYYCDAYKHDRIKLKSKDITISPYNASSGVQSVLPLVVMVDYLCSQDLFDKISISKYNIIDLFRQIFSKEISDDIFSTFYDKAQLLEKIKDVNRADLNEKFRKNLYLYKYRCAKLFIEEPEQNLFPESQQLLVNYLVKKLAETLQFTDMNSTLTMTTHSPYIITAFNVLLKAHSAYEKDKAKTLEIVDEDSIISIDKIRAYFLVDGKMENIVNKELNMISGVDLDKASEIVENQMELLDNIIYE